MEAEIGKAWGQLSRGMRYDYSSGVIHGDLRIADLAHAMAGIHRYNSWTGLYWSLASHACLVAEIIAAMVDYPPAVVLGGLHHDDHETLVGDMSAPFQLAWSDEMHAEWKNHVRKAQLAIVRRLGIYNLIPEEKPALAVIKAADIAALEAERRWLFAVQLPWETEKIVNPKMLEIAQRILPADFSRKLGGQLAADRFISHHNALIQRMGQA